MIQKNTLVRVLVLTFLFFLIPSVYSLNISINETSSIDEVDRGIYSIDSKGTFKIENPTNKSSIYESKIYFNFTPTIGLSAEPIFEEITINQTNQTNNNSSNNETNINNTNNNLNNTNNNISQKNPSFNKNHDEITIRNIEANSSFKFEYSIYGLTEDNIYDEVEKSSVFEYFLEDIKLRSISSIHVKKPEIENITF